MAKFYLSLGVGDGLGRLVDDKPGGFDVGGAAVDFIAVVVVALEPDGVVIGRKRETTGAKSLVGVLGGG